MIGALCVASMLFASCSDESIDRSMRLAAFSPVLASCSDAVQERLKDALVFDDFAGEYMQFDSDFPTHPDIAGFVWLTNEKLGRDELTKYLNGLTEDCLGRYRDEYRTDSQEDSELLFEFLRQVETGSVSFRKLDGTIGKVAPDHLYLVHEPGRVILYFDVN